MTNADILAGNPGILDVISVQYTNLYIYGLSTKQLHTYCGCDTSSQDNQAALQDVPNNSQSRLLTRKITSAGCRHHYALPINQVIFAFNCSWHRLYSYYKHVYGMHSLMSTLQWLSWNNINSMHEATAVHVNSMLQHDTKPIGLLSQERDVCKRKLMHKNTKIPNRTAAESIWPAENAYACFNASVVIVTTE